MYRRSLLSWSAVAVVGATGCLDGTDTADVTIVGGHVVREAEGTAFVVTLNLERTGSGGEYDVSVELADAGGSIVLRRVRGEVTDETDRWTVTNRIDLDDSEGVDALDEDYEATVTLVDEDESAALETR